LKLSKRETVLLLVLVVLTAVLAGWHFMFFPLLSSAAELRSERAALLPEQERLADQLSRRGELSAARERWQAQAPALNSSLPPPGNLPEVLTNLELLLAASPVTLQTFQAGSMAPEEGHLALRITLRGAGEPEALLGLLERLERFGHLLLVDRIDWSQQEEEAAILEISFRLIFYPPSE